MNLRQLSHLGLSLLCASVLAACENKKSETKAEQQAQKEMVEAEMKLHTVDEEIEMFRQAREQEMSDIEKGVPMTGANACKYASSLSNAAPRGLVNLTFDDGPHPTVTPHVLSVLRKYGIKATFFMKGANAASYASIVRQVEAEGHIVASHSWSHPNFWTLSSEAQKAQITGTEVPLRGYMKGRPLFRYPYGNSTCESNQTLRARGYKIVGWHVDSCDWAYSKTGAVSSRDARICGVAGHNMSDFANHVVESVERKGGGVLLLHDVHSRTMAQLDSIISSLMQSGFRFGNLDDSRFESSLR